MNKQIIMVVLGLSLIGIFAYFLLRPEASKIPAPGASDSQALTTPTSSAPAGTPSSPAPVLDDLVNVATPGATSFPDNKISLIVLKEGSGSAQTKAGDALSVHYTGWLLNGQKFDSSLDRGAPFTFNLGAGQVIKGWDLGLVSMKVGETRRLIIPSFFAYGDQANGPIPANSPLLFEVQLLKIN